MIVGVRRRWRHLRGTLTINISLRELIVIVAYCALGIAALRAGGWLAALVVFSGIVLVMALAIIAFVGTAQPKAFATGFLLSTLVYAATVIAAGNNELDPYDGRLPTTIVLRYAHHALVTTTWTDFATGKVVPDYDPAKDAQLGNGGGGFGGPSVMLQESPDRPTFMSTGHMLLAMMLGWVGGKFAIYVYRTQRPPQKCGEPSDEPKSR